MPEQISLDVRLPQSPDPELYHYYKGIKNRTFYINDEINSFVIDLIGIPLLDADREDSTKPITIYLNTPGGDVFSGLAICNIIETLKSPVEIIVPAHAYSMGALILLAGANKPNITRKCFTFSTGLLHGGSGLIAGTKSQMKDFYKFEERYEEKIKDFVVKRSKMTPEEYDLSGREEVYMTSDEMLEKGFIDEIIE